MITGYQVCDKNGASHGLALTPEQAETAARQLETRFPLAAPFTVQTVEVEEASGAVPEDRGPFFDDPWLKYRITGGR